jgi:hypothetical protein
MTPSQETSASPGTETIPRVEEEPLSSRCAGKLPPLTLVLAGALAAWCGGAHAYRPFDGSNAAISDPGQMVIELGPVGYLREGSQHTLLAPSAVFNYGFAPGWQAVVQGQGAHGISGDLGGTSLIAPAAFLTTMLRDGVLQGKTGPSITTQFGVLLPGIRDDRGTGASLSGALSQQWDWASVHLNAAASLTRQQHTDLFLGVIIEGPQDWPVRPVAEIFYDRAFGELKTHSALVGAIWQVKDDVALDFGLRGARVNDQTVYEIRAGVSFQFNVP